jgi:DNA invertase Pin-like site-specific DNA recombinase
MYKNPYNNLRIEKVPFMIIGYARVSTTEQDTKLQLDALQVANCEQVYQESRSGATRERPELIRCLDTLRPGDTLVVWRLDRLGRSLKDLVDIVTELESRGVSFKSLTEAIDTTNTSGKLIFHIFAALSEFERSLIQERTKAGLEAARARGRKGGRPKKLSKTQVQKAKAMLSDPLITKTEIAKHFRVTRATLNKALAEL